MSEKTQTLGEKRLRTEFNPSKEGNVDFIKQSTAKIIDVLEDYKNDPRNEIDAESYRLIATAQTHFENAALWGIKAVTK